MRKALVVLLIFAFMGCMPGYSVVPDTSIQKVASAKKTLEAANNSIADLLRADKISVEDAVNYREKAEQVRIALNTAESLVLKGESLDGMDEWTLANTILLEINKYLLEHGGR